MSPVQHPLQPCQKWVHRPWHRHDLAPGSQRCKAARAGQPAAPEIKPDPEVKPDLKIKPDPAVKLEPEIKEEPEPFTIRGYFGIRD